MADDFAVASRCGPSAAPRVHSNEGQSRVLLVTELRCCLSLQLLTVIT